jgi:hypothetical protein
MYFPSMNSLTRLAAGNVPFQTGLHIFDPDDLITIVAESL